MNRSIRSDEFRFFNPFASLALRSRCISLGSPRALRIAAHFQQTTQISTTGTRCFVMKQSRRGLSFTRCP